MSPPEMANGNGPILKRGGAGFPTVSFPVVIISLAKKLISIPNGKAGMQSIEDQFGPYGDPVR